VTDRTETFMTRPTSTYPTVQITPEDRMRFTHAGRARAAIAVAAAVALTAAASPAAAQVHSGVERGTGHSRGRYQLRLDEARSILRR
jgi:ferredoxin-NADP reductase